MHSLLNQFEGTLVGAAVGEWLGSRYQHDGSQHNEPLSSRLTPPPYGWSLARLQQHSLERSPGWAEIALRGASSLIHLGRFQLDDWHRRTCRDVPDSERPSGFASCSEAAIACLPVALFYHENEQQLQRCLLESGQIWLDDPELRAGVLLAGRAIARSLTSTCQTVGTPPALILEEITSGLTPFPTAFKHQLTQLQELLQERASLEQAKASLIQPDRVLPGSIPLLLALYCTFSTPASPEVALWRAVQCNYQPATVAALTGALIGTQHSIGAIPLPWQLALNFTNTDVTASPAQVPQLSELWNVSSQLIAVWSGASDRVLQTATAVESMPIAAAAGSIRPR